MFNNIICLNRSYYVGELGTAWEFPSDHLPIGLNLEHFNIAFWNILNKNYLHHIESNTQGLKDSAILRDNVLDQDPLALREIIVKNYIFEMIHHPTHPRALIGLQEVHDDILAALKNQLPPEWKIVLLVAEPHPRTSFYLILRFLI